MLAKIEIIFPLNPNKAVLISSSRDSWGVFKLIGFNSCEDLRRSEREQRLEEKRNEGWRCKDLKQTDYCRDQAQILKKTFQLRTKHLCQISKDVEKEEGKFSFILVIFGLKMSL